jgi:hypothetical protein
MNPAALVAVAALAAGQPPMEPVVPTAKAPIVVAGTPISRGYLRHYMEIADLARTGERLAALREQVANVLIGHRWIRGEAAERGIEVNRGEVTRAFRRQRRASFVRRRDFRKFLRDSGQTVGDIRTRVQIDLLSTRIRRQVTEGAATPEEQQERLDEFVREFRRKWRARTVCREPWVAPDCGGQASRSPR